MDMGIRHFAGMQDGEDGGCLMESLDLGGTGEEGPLTGYSAVVKDSYDIEGYRTSNGSPDWRESHPVATDTAPAVSRLLEAGCKVVGKAVMDEMAYSLEGQNHHYGTPVNPACPSRIPGGSSSGTAAAVARGLADIGLGGDTGGSVRIPASFCGIYGIRPTHGRVDISKSCPLAPSFDTGGWFARDAGLLERVGHVLLDPATRYHAPLPRWGVGVDAFDLVPTSVSKAIYTRLSSNFEGVKGILGSPVEVTIASVEGLDLEGWVDVFRVCQGWEIWKTHGAWIEKEKPNFGPGIKERFEMASKITEEEFIQAHDLRDKIAKHLDSLLENTMLTIPTAYGPAPKIGLAADELGHFRSKTLALTSIAGLAGLPQITIPLATVESCPLGMSIVGPKGSDEHLLHVATILSRLLSET